MAADFQAQIQHRDTENRALQVCACWDEANAYINLNLGIITFSTQRYRH